MEHKFYRKIGIIGFGVMGSSIAERLKSHYELFVFDKDVAKTAQVNDIHVKASIWDVLYSVKVIVLAVKPQDLPAVLEEIRDTLYANADKKFSEAVKAQDRDAIWEADKERLCQRDVRHSLFISIAAGISTARIEKILGNVRVVRVMPNIALKIGEGVACLAKGKFATEEDFDFSEGLFEHMGETLKIEEALMNAATAVSGSGPGFFYDTLERKKINLANSVTMDDFVKNTFIPELQSAAQEIGFPKEEAEFLAVTTATSSIVLLKKSNMSPTVLKKEVASKGGTTEAGLEVLERGGSLSDAVKAALKRAEELSGG